MIRTLFLLALLPWAAQAHDIVLVPAGKAELVVRYGHPGDWQRVEERRLVDVQTYALNGPAQQRLTELRPVPAGFGKPPLDLRLSNRGSDTRLIAARYDNGYWARVPVPGQVKPFTRNTTRALLPEAALVTNNLKFAKALVLDERDEVSFQRKLGHLLELVPQKNPATVRPGEMLPVQVLLGGQPLAGAGIEVGNSEDVISEEKIVRHPTNAAGIAQVPLLAKGLNVIVVGAERPNDGSLLPKDRLGGADRLALVATFSFIRP
jgi:nickel transport protein